MKQRLLQQIGRSARLKVINELKRTQGLPVGQLALRLKMSYMGVKGVCLDLEKRGLLDTWREPPHRGRPQMLYRLTGRAHDLFPTASNELTVDLLHAAQRLYGPSASEKLLLLVFQKKTELYSSRIAGQTVRDRAEALAGLRDKEGCMAEMEPTADAPSSMCILEHHSPILDVLRAFPIVSKFETEMFQKVLGAPVEREETCASGLFCATYRIGK